GCRATHAGVPARGARLASDLGDARAGGLWRRLVLAARAGSAAADDVCVPALAVPARHDHGRPLAGSLLSRSWFYRNRIDDDRLFPAGALVAPVDGCGAERHAHPRRRLALEKRPVAMSGSNDVIHQAMRLRIMAALNALAARQGAIEFTKLKGLVGAT